MEESYPVLCGGTFFSLILLYLKPKGDPLEPSKKEREGFCQKDVLKALVRTLVPDLQKKIDEGKCSRFRACQESFSAISGVDPQSVCVNEKALDRMESFVNKYIVSNEEGKIAFARKLMSLIQQDESIKENEKFYVCKDGKFLKKISQAGEKLEVSFSGLLVGIWQYAIKIDEEKGRATFEKWHTHKGERCRWQIVKNINDYLDYKGEICFRSERAKDIGDDGTAQDDATQDSTTQDNTRDDSVSSISQDEAASYVSGGGAALAIPSECKVCLCCKDWHGNLFRALKDTDGVYGDCDARGERVLSTSFCDKFRINYNAANIYLEHLKFPYIGTISK